MSTPPPMRPMFRHRGGRVRPCRSHLGPAPMLAALFATLAAGLVVAPRPAMAADAIAWGNAVPWLDYDVALRRAAAEGKAVGVVVYADWCPKCRQLAPLFTSGPVVESSSKLLWVLQNHDARPDWLEQKFAAFGSYVPRIFFLGPDGRVAEEITSGHPRFPYFYLAAKPEALIASIDRAAAMAPGTVAPATGAPATAAAAPPAAAAPVPPPPSAAPPAGAPAPWQEDLPLYAILVAALAAAAWALRGGSAPSTPGAESDDGPRR